MLGTCALEELSLGARTMRVLVGVLRCRVEATCRRVFDGVNRALCAREERASVATFSAGGVSGS